MEALRHESLPRVAPATNAVDVARLLTRTRAEAVEVVSATGGRLGTIGAQDLVAFLAGRENLFDSSVEELLGLPRHGPPRPGGAPGDRTAQDIMSTPAIACPEDMPVQDVADLLATRGLSGVPVVDRAQKVVGVISTRDIVHALGGPSPELHLLHPASTGPFLRGPQAGSARDVMRPPTTASPQISMRALAGTMLAERKDGVVIVAEGRPVGMVTRADILRAVVDDPVRAGTASGAE